MNIVDRIKPRSQYAVINSFYYYDNDDNILKLLSKRYTERQLNKGIITKRKYLKQLMGNKIYNYPHCPCCGRLIIPRLIKNYRNIGSEKRIISSFMNCHFCASLDDKDYYSLFATKRKDNHPFVAWHFGYDGYIIDD